MIRKYSLASLAIAGLALTACGAVGRRIGSRLAQDTMVYSGGHWYGHIDDSTMAIYAGGTVASAIAAAKTKNLCVTT